MSYKSEFDQIKKNYENRKKILGKLIKVTVVVLAATILVTAVTAGVLAVVDGFSPNYTEDEPASDGNDKKAPTITGPEGDVAVAYLGETISYKSLVKVKDNSGKVKLNVDNASVDPNVAGTYRVTYTATDPSGNSTTYTLTLYLRKRTVTDADLAKLNDDIAAKAAELGITSAMSKEQQVRKVYDYVNNHVQWGSDRSNIMDTHGSAFTRDTWQTDWQEEAILALEKGKGDCYSYYSLSKAFFEYLGIENLGIKRSERSSEAGTHFWNVVNIGTKSEPRWYYYDATELAGKFSDGTDYGCLMTEAKLNSYTTSKGGKQFYIFDKWTDFPEISKETLQ